MGACEDGGCYDIPPPQGAGNGPFVLTVVRDANGGMPYWEAIANIAAPPAVPVPGPVGKKKRGRKK
jgi:hypothetical protein